MIKVLNASTGSKQEEYQKLFRRKLQDFGVESPNDLSDADKKAFYESVDSEWNTPDEPGKDSEVDEDSE